MTTAAKKPRKTRKKTGRPTTLTPQVEEHLLRLITEGNNVITACEKAGVGYHTLRHREAVDPEFSQSLARASLWGTQAALARAEDRLEKADPKNISVIREIALHWRWVASKLLPVYRDRIGVALQAQLDVVQRDPNSMSLLETAQRMAFVFAEADALLPKDQPETLRLPAPTARPLHNPDPDPVDHPVEREVYREVPARDAEVWVDHGKIERESEIIEQGVSSFNNRNSSTIYSRRRR